MRSSLLFLILDGMVRRYNYDNIYITTEPNIYTRELAKRVYKPK